MRAYALLAADLERFRWMPYGELARRVGGAPVEWSVETEDGPLKVEVTFGWALTGKYGVRISATAHGRRRKTSQSFMHAILRALAQAEDGIVANYASPSR